MLALSCRNIISTSMTRLKSGRKLSSPHVGQKIKRLNKENKYLFGELLETKKERRKREACGQTAILEGSKSVLNSSSKPDVSSEVWWWERSVHRTAQKIGSAAVQACDSTAAEVDFNKKLSSGRHTGLPQEVLGKGRSVLSTQSEEPARLQLPDIIVRNITTFPLINSKKQVDEQAHKRGVMNISENEVCLSHGSQVKCYPSVTKVLNETLSETSLAALQRWKENLISQLGEEGFHDFHKDLLQRGSKFHEILRMYLSGTPSSSLNIDHTVEGCWRSVASVLSNVSNVKALESRVLHPILMYHGVIDCVAHYRGKPVLIEWKRSEKQKAQLHQTYDAPLQLCAYLGAMNYDASYNLEVLNGLVVVAYDDGSPAHAFAMNLNDCVKYWSLWLGRLQKYWLQVNKT